MIAFIDEEKTIAKVWEGMLECRNRSGVVFSSNEEDVHKKEDTADVDKEEVATDVIQHQNCEIRVLRVRRKIEDFLLVQVSSSINPSISPDFLHLFH